MFEKCKWNLIKNGKKKKCCKFSKTCYGVHCQTKKIKCHVQKSITEKLEEGCRVHILDKGKCKRTRCCKWKRRCVDGKCSIVHNRCFYRGLKNM